MVVRKSVIGFAAAAIAASSLGAFGLASQQAERADCPGRVVCPITGEPVCSDRCPVIDQQRDDCPGRIECPIDGELLCRDRCPLQGDAETTGDEALPDCCRK